MTSITQDMRYRLSFIEYTQRYGISKATRKTKWSIHLSLNSSWESLHDRSRRPHSTMDQKLQNRRLLPYSNAYCKNIEFAISSFIPRYDEKVELRHQKDNERFYVSHMFCSFEYFSTQLQIYNYRIISNFPCILGVGKLLRQSLGNLFSMM